MGTRGAVCLVVDGTEKVIYNHWDSYPDGLGEGVASWLRDSLADEDAARHAVQSLQPVDATVDPTAEDFERYGEFHDPNVSTGKDWYSLLRHTQGNLPMTLKAGLYEPSPDFPLDSLFCEWAYVVDFDARQFEVYEGFRQTPPTDGRWVGKRGDDDQYYPVQRVAAWSFDDLPAAHGIAAHFGEDAV